MSINDLTTPQSPWPDDPLERLEAKLDTYRDEMRVALYGGPGTVGALPRLAGVERDVAGFKRAGAVVATGGVALLWDYIKRKLSL